MQDRPSLFAHSALAPCKTTIYCQRSSIITQSSLQHKAVTFNLFLAYEYRRKPLLTCTISNKMITLRPV